ncbi:MAG: hypothetical protein IRZ08_08680 [Frankia sp.]|nr:hypothetical protein [Frankia sp.]
MSRYAVDLQERALLVSWDTGLGDVAQRVATLPAAVDESDALQLARTLTFLSTAAWRCYTHPAEAAAELAVTGTAATESDAGRRDLTGAVLAAIERPHLPHDGLIQQAVVVLEEAAHRVGRALHAIADPALTRQVAADVRAELAAVERAELGELSGRSRQAVTLSRADASPPQVAAADALLRSDPLGCRSLFTDVEPTAAAIAAAHWLHAAATVAARHAGLEVTEVVAEADAIEPLPHRTPTLVLHQMESGEPPRAAVLDLIAHAMVVAEGRNPDLAELVDWVTEIVEGGQEGLTGRGPRTPPPGAVVPEVTIRIAGMPADQLADELAEELAEELARDELELSLEDDEDDEHGPGGGVDTEDEDDEEDFGRTLVLADRITPLDPRRPAVDLLEDLLAGIHGCWLIYREFADPPGVASLPEPQPGTAPTAEAVAAVRRRRREQLRRAFDEEVRAAAAALPDRLA